MIESTYADRKFATDVALLASNSTRIATALEAVANHLGVISGIARNKMLKQQFDCDDRPHLTGSHNP